MKTILAVFGLLLACTFGARAIQQDLSFLTNRTSLASYALKQIQRVDVSAYADAAVKPSKWNGVTIEHKGEATVEALAYTASLARFDISVANTNGGIYVDLQFYGKSYTNQPHTPLFMAGVYAKPVYDVKEGVWKFPTSDARPELYMNSRIFIRAPGINYAALITTNIYGNYTSRSLEMDYENEGFWFDADMCGGGDLVCAGWETDEAGEVYYAEYVYNLRGSGQKELPTRVQVAVLLRDSSEMRDFGVNPSVLGYWMYIWTVAGEIGKGGVVATANYGKVPLYVAKYTTGTYSYVYLGSSIGTATSFVVENLTTGQKYTLTLKPGDWYIQTYFEPGVYHITPLGLDVTSDWWWMRQVLDQVPIVATPMKG